MGSDLYTLLIIKGFRQFFAQKGDFIQLDRRVRPQFWTRERLLATCFPLIDELGERELIQSPALQRLHLLEQVITNALLHNPDAHLKNYAFLYQEDGTLEVSPLYDCLCTHGLKFSSGEGGAWEWMKATGGELRLNANAKSACLGFSPVLVFQQAVLQQAALQILFERLPDELALLREFLQNKALFASVLGSRSFQPVSLR